jgi:hypothetical protein
MARKKKPELPRAGAAFAFPIGDGRLSVCRVLLDASSERAKEWGGDAVLVACSSWIGNEIPSADDPALRPILHLNHHAWVNDPRVLWVSDVPPADLIPIGTIEPTPEERAFPCMTFGDWSGLTVQPLAQWRWDHDRAAVIKKDAVDEKEEAEVRQHARLEREQYLERVTLDDLRGRRFFPNWKGYPPAKAVRASRKVMADTVEELHLLGPEASEEDRLAVLRRCIESFNGLDAETEFIETVEREDICEEFEAIVHACGLGRHADLADQWREW